MVKTYVTNWSPGFNDGNIAVGETHRVNLLREYGRSFEGGSIELITALAEITVTMNDGPRMVLDDDASGFFIGFIQGVNFQVDEIRITNTGTIDAAYRVFFC